MQMRRLVSTIVLAFVLWAVMFSPLSSPYVSFWWTMTASALALTAFATLYRPQWLREVSLSPAEIGLGLGLAVVLWLVFWVGDKVSSLIIPYARARVILIYMLKSGQSQWLIALLLLLFIGPAEEIFWRGYVQRTLSVRFSPNAGLVVTVLLYALVHAVSCNFMLVCAALVAGVVWSLFYRLFPQRLGSLIVSHAVWDVLVFIVFPI